MPGNPAIKRKQYALNEKKIKRAQKLLGTKSEAEISDREAQRRAWVATERFIKSGAVIDDVFDRLDTARE